MGNGTSSQRESPKQKTPDSALCSKYEKIWTKFTEFNEEHYEDSVKLLKSLPNVDKSFTIYLHHTKYGKIDSKFLIKYQIVDANDDTCRTYLRSLPDLIDYYETNGRCFRDFIKTWEDLRKMLADFEDPTNFIITFQKNTPQQYLSNITNKFDKLKRDHKLYSDNFIKMALQFNTWHEILSYDLDEGKNIIKYLTSVGVFKESAPTITQTKDLLDLSNDA